MGEDSKGQELRPGTRNKNVPWFFPGPPEIPPPARELLEVYSNILPDEIQAHVHHVRDRAWDIYPYPCIGGYRFLELNLSRHDAYAELLTLLKAHDASSSASAPLLLDIGCCFGQDIRKLTYDGVPGAQLIGADLQSGFIEMGYELFRDRETTKSKFLIGDVLSSTFAKLRGTISVVHAASFLHLWGWEGQVNVAKSIVKLLKDEPGVMIIGSQVGSVEPGERQAHSSSKSRMYRHDPTTFEKLWEEVGKATGTKWRVKSRLEAPRNRSNRDPQKELTYESSWHDETVRRISFLVTRI